MYNHQDYKSDCTDVPTVFKHCKQAGRSLLESVTGSEPMMTEQEGPRRHQERSSPHNPSMHLTPLRCLGMTRETDAEILGESAAGAERGRGSQPSAVW